MKSPVLMLRNKCEVSTVWCKPFPKWRFRRIALETAPFFPPSAALLGSPPTLSADGWVMCDKESPTPPKKSCVYMPKHIFTSTALISLQPEAHKSPQCVCSAGKQKQLMDIYSRPCSLARSNSECCCWYLWVHSVDGENNPAIHIYIY